MVVIEDYATKLASGALTGADLAKLVVDGILDKSQRRSITKRAAKISSQGLKAGGAEAVNAPTKLSAAPSVDKAAVESTKKRKLENTDRSQLSSKIGRHNTKEDAPTAVAGFYRSIIIIIL